MQGNGLLMSGPGTSWMKRAKLSLMRTGVRAGTRYATRAGTVAPLGAGDVVDHRAASSMPGRLLKLFQVVSLRRS